MHSQSNDKEGKTEANLKSVAGQPENSRNNCYAEINKLWSALQSSPFLHHKILLKKRSTEMCLWKHFDKSELFCNNILWLDKKKKKQNTLVGERKVVYMIQRTSYIPTVKHGGGSMGLCTALHVIKGNTNGAIYQQYIEENLISLAKKLHLGWRCIFQQDNEINNTTVKITQ